MEMTISKLNLWMEENRIRKHIFLSEMDKFTQAGCC